MPRFSLVLWRWPRGGVWWCCRWWCRSLSLSLASLVDRGGHRGVGRRSLSLDEPERLSRSDEPGRGGSAVPASTSSVRWYGGLSSPLLCIADGLVRAAGPQQRTALAAGRLQGARRRADGGEVCSGRQDTDGFPLRFLVQRVVRCKVLAAFSSSLRTMAPRLKRLLRARRPHERHGRPRRPGWWQHARPN